jgi:peptide chain release factor 3
MADSAFILQMAQNEFKNIRFHFTSEFWFLCFNFRFDL